MKFEYYKSSDGWRWRLVARNGEVVATGEAYHNKGDVMDTLIAIQHGIANAPIVEVDHKQIGNIVEHDVDDPADTHF